MADKTTVAEKARAAKADMISALEDVRANLMAFAESDSDEDARGICGKISKDADAFNGARMRWTEFGNEDPGNDPLLDEGRAALASGDGTNEEELESIVNRAEFPYQLTALGYRFRLAGRYKAECLASERLSKMIIGICVGNIEGLLFRRVEYGKPSEPDGAIATHWAAQTDAAIVGLGGKSDPDATRFDPNMGLPDFIY